MRLSPINIETSYRYKKHSRGGNDPHVELRVGRRYWRHVHRCRAAGRVRPHLGRQDPDHTQEPGDRLLHRGRRRAEDCRHCARRRHRRAGACDDRRHQCGDRAQGAADRATRHRGLPRHPLDPRRASLRDVRSADRVSRAAHRPRDDVRCRGAHARDRRGHQAGRHQADRGAGRRIEEEGRCFGRRLAAQCLPQSGRTSAPSATSS